ncbi:Glycerol-3-phosphate acyltransferase 2 [Hibiscus syriacus]|uniref:Glycerol-3-phosphate acyltransferase 2 n=1 Tax=Hibiscus syriacus TaxID=106335 RepID=A0A6A3CPS8_HIBSY|nr:Glycerol-3-phosphate acyltransferase 2 [Hibiscus syriacus]
MKEIKVKDASSLCTIVPDTEPGIRQPASQMAKGCCFLGIVTYWLSLILDAGCGNGKYLDAVNLPYRANFGDAAISIAVLHHLKDRSLLAKWTPLAEKYVEEWIGPGSPRVRGPSSLTLESIPETEENGLGGHPKDSRESLTGTMLQPMCSTPQNEDDSLVSNDGRNQQEYFVPWHLPYHRAEVSGASASALENGLAKKDDKKGAVVYNRYYHVFGEGELERLVSGMDNAVIVDKFYDKSNWCIILEKTLEG